MAKPEDYRGYYQTPLSSLSAPYQDGSDWYQRRENFVKFPPARSKRGTKGPRSLAATCLRVLADNIADVSDGALHDIPDQLKRALFRELYPRNMPLHAWHALSPAFFPDPSEWEQAEQLPAFENPVVWRSDCDGKGKGKEKEVVATPFDRALAAGVSQTTKDKEKEGPTTEMGALRFSLDIGAPQCRLSTYITPFMDWTEGLIYFCIDNVTRFQTHELIPLAKLRRLAVLEIVERQKDEESMIKDRLFRGWAEGEGERFPALRVLRIASKSHQVSDKSLQYALSFPSLEIFDIIALPSSELRSDEAKKIADRCGWKVDEVGNNIYKGHDGEPEKNLFVSYAEAYLNGRVPVHKVGVLGFKKVFDNDKQGVVWVDNPRRLLYPKGEKSRETEDEKSRETEDEKRKAEEGGGHVEANSKKPDLRDYIDDGWQTILKGTHPLSRLAKFSMEWNRNHFDMTKDQVFWFLALLDQCQNGEKQPAIQRQAAGVTLPGDRFVTFTLCDAAYGKHDDKVELYKQRLIFSRSRDAKARRQRAEAAEQRSDPAPSWAPRPDDRREENLQAPKRQKRSVGDLLSSVTG